jgi:PAS domain S-box-containing protein
MSPGFRTSLAAGFFLAVAALGLNAIVSARNLSRLAENNRRALRSDKVVRSLSATLSTLKDAETGQRGYLLTRREEYFAPYQVAIDSLGGHIRGLEELVDGPDQQPRLRALESKVAEKLDELKETVSLCRQDRHGDAIKVVLSDRGKRLMDDIRRIMGEMEETERNRLNRRIAESEASLAWTAATVAVASVTALLLVASLGLVVARHLVSRERNQKALQHQLERWQVTLSSIGDAVIVADVDGRVTFMNAAAESLCGWASDSGAGRPLPEVFRIVNEATREVADNPANRVLRDGIVVGLANHTLLISADGTERPIHDSAAPIRDTQGRINGVVLVFRDDTERRNHERELVEANRRKDEFLAMLAHELRNPVAAIRTAVESFDVPATGDHLDWATGVIVRQVSHLARLLDDLLDVSRITRGMIPIRKQLIDAYPVINQVVESIRPLIEDRHQRLEVSMPGRPLRLEADPIRLEQVLFNLLTNAAKYTPARGRIAISAEQVEDQIIIRVADEGMGIPPEVLPRIFDLFVQGERALARSEGGLGIGLTIVRKMVELHGGSVSARSEGPGRGSEFTVRLPAAADAPAAPSRAAAPTERRCSRILIVDDNKDLVQGLSRLLRMLGHEVQSAYDGPEGIEAARSYRPEVILLDIGLPSMDGYSVARALRIEGFQDTLIIAISGYGQEGDRRRSLESGMDHHLTKPVDLKTITDLLAQPR